MSPTEFDLRNALHDGEGGGVDADRIVRAVRARRVQRRNRLLAGAAAVVVTAGVATGIGVLAGHESSVTADGAKGAASRAGSLRASDLPAAASSRPSTVAGVGSAPGPSQICPSTYPRLMLPGGGGSGRFGATGPMFAATPATVLVCAYGPDGAGGGPARLELTGAAARQLVDSLNGAAVRPTVYPCPQSADPQQNRLAIIATTADGTVLRTVTTEVRVPQCNVQVTNGTAVRYQWRPPSDLAAILLALTPRSASTTNPPNPPNTPGTPISKTPIR